jgi:hypothetical protein
MSDLILLGPRLTRVLGAEHEALAREVSARFQVLQVALDKQRGNPGPKTVGGEGAKNDRKQALENLDGAAKIYERLKHQRGLGNTSIEQGKIFLDRGDYENAGAMAARGMECGERTRNHKIRARAALLATAVEYEKWVEEIDDGTDHARKAQGFAKAALVHAEQAEPRLRGRAYAWLGLTSLMGGTDRQQAESFRNKARAIARNYPGGSLERELAALQAHLAPAGAAADAAVKLREWIDTRSGRSLEDLDGYIAQLAWQDANNIHQFAQALGLEFNTAKRLLQHYKLI